jgi:hypothetical protein
MLEDELKQSVIELQELVKRTFDYSSELVSRAGDAFRSQMAIESEWSSISSPSKQRVADYLEESQLIKTLAQEFSRWIKEHPESDTGYLKSASEQLRMLPTDDKMAFIRNLKEDRIDRLENQLPELKSLVEKIEASLQKLKAIATPEAR